MALMPTAHKFKVPAMESEQERHIKWIVSQCQEIRVSKYVLKRTRFFGFSRAEILGDFQKKSSLEWQPWAPDGSGLRNKGKEGRGDGEGDTVSKVLAMKRRRGGGSLRGRHDQRPVADL